MVISMTEVPCVTLIERPLVRSVSNVLHCQRTPSTFFFLLFVFANSPDVEVDNEYQIEFFPFSIQGLYKTKGAVEHTIM